MRPPDRSVEHHPAIGLHTDLSYLQDSNPAHTLDLYLPDGKTGEPLIMFVHGGAWISGDKSLCTGLGKRFARAGYAVAVPNYRLSPEGSPVVSPDHVKDAAAAYAWLEAHAGDYGFSAKDIFVGGHSAGGHTAGMLATGSFLKDAGAREMPAGFYGLEGVYDIPALDQKFPKYRSWFLNKGFGGGANWKKLSPTRRPLVVNAPWLLVQSNEDELVDKGQMIGFKEHLTEQHVVSLEAVTDDLGTHDGMINEVSETGNKTDKIIIEWIEGVLKHRK